MHVPSHTVVPNKLMIMRIICLTVYTFNVYFLWNFRIESRQFYVSFQDRRQAARTSDGTDSGYLEPTIDGGEAGEVVDGRHRLRAQALRGGGLTGGGEEWLDSRRWPRPGTRRAGFRLSFMRCFAWDRPEGSAANLAAKPVSRLGAAVVEWEWCPAEVVREQAELGASRATVGLSVAGTIFPVL